MAVIAWSLLSAIMFAGTFLLIKLGQRNASTLTSLWLTLSVNVVVLWSWSLCTQRPSIGDWWDWRHFALAGFFAPLLGRLCQFVGLTHLGVNITTPITLTHPLVTVLIAVLLLGETMTLATLIGGILVLLGSLLIGTQGLSLRGTGAALATGSRRYLLFPVGASLAYGISMVFRKMGIDLGTDPVTASAVTTFSSWVLVSLYVLLSGRAGTIRCSKSEAGYLTAAGILSSLGPVFFYLALQRGELIVVAPLAATTPLFVILATWLISRKGELFNRSVVIGTLFTVLGVNVMTVF